MASAYLDPLPELLAPVSAVLVTSPAEYDDWADLLNTHPNATDYILRGEDYTDWGVLELDDGDMGTAQRRKVIRSETTALHPVHRAPADEVLIAGITLGDASGNATQHWILHGLTMRGGSHENQIRHADTTNIRVDSCLIEEWNSNYGIRILLFAQDVIVQRTVIRNRPVAAGDAVGVQIRVPTAGQGSGTMYGNMVLDCEIYNYVDPVALTQPSGEPENSGILNGTVIDGNDLYTTSDYHVANGQGLTENGLDLKGGSSDPDDPVMVSNNRIWGYRKNDGLVMGSSSDGVGVVTHNYASNVTYRQNIIMDCAGGFREPVQLQDDPQGAGRNIRYEHNVVAGIRAFAAGDNGYAFDVRQAETMVGNVVSACATLAYQDVAGGQSAHAMHGNMAQNTPLGSYAAHWNGGTGNETREFAETGPLILSRKRITGPETIHVPGCVYKPALGGLSWMMRPASYSRRRR